MNWYPWRDLNPQHLVPKTNASSSWATWAHLVAGVVTHGFMGPMWGSQHLLRACWHLRICASPRSRWDAAGSSRSGHRLLVLSPIGCCYPKRGTPGVNRTLPTSLEDQCWKTIHRDSNSKLLPRFARRTKLS